MPIMLATDAEPAAALSHESDLVLTLAVALAAALLFGFLAQRLRLSPIVGYLMAGVAVGPFTPGFVAHGPLVEQLAELGVVLLLFGVGLHFHPHELLAVRRVALVGAGVQMLVASGLGVALARWLGWSLGAGLVLGMAVAIASTIVVLRVLADRELLHTRAGHVALGWLLVQDLATVLVLVLVPILAGPRTQKGASHLLASLALALVEIGALALFTLAAGKRLIPRVLAYVARTRSRELFTLSVLVIALGIAVSSARLFGASLALGAFLAGLVVGQSPFGSRAASEALPMRDAFAVLFFVSMGMLFDPGRVVENAALTAATLGLVLVVNPIVALAVLLGLRESVRTAVVVVVALTQIGEFSFLLAGLGRQLQILPEAASQSLVAAALVSITLNPLLLRLAAPAERRIGAALALQPPPVPPPEPAVDPAHRAIVIGYGPVGRTLVGLLRENAIEPTVIEMNHETVERLRALGVRVLHGDAAQRAILQQAGIDRCGSLVFAASGSPDAVIRAATDLNPEILILARATYLSEVHGLERAGARSVVAAEGEVALAMAERLLAALGATSEQLDHLRDRVRSELGIR
jgi:CPA2 family monovalent cation:H+ antiporter-2